MTQFDPNIFSNLEGFSLGYRPQLKILAISRTMQKLKTINIRGGDEIQQINGLENCKSLEEIVLPTAWKGEKEQNVRATLPHVKISY